MKFALHTSTAISSVLKEPEHFYVDIYYLIILIIVAFTLLLLSFLRYHLYKTKKEKVYRAIRPGRLYQVLYSTGAFQVDERVQLRQNKRYGHSKKGRRGEGDVLQVF